MTYAQLQTKFHELSRSIAKHETEMAVSRAPEPVSPTESEDSERRVAYFVAHEGLAGGPP